MGHAFASLEALMSMVLPHIKDCDPRLAIIREMISRYNTIQFCSGTKVPFLIREHSRFVLLNVPLGKGNTAQIY